MDLLPTIEQTQILDAAIAFLAAEAPIERLRPRRGQYRGDDARLWPELGERGFLGLSIAEQEGGVGLGLAEEILLFREFGRHLVSPAILGFTLGARLAAHADDAVLLDSFISGAVRIALVIPRGPNQLGPVSSGDFHLLDSSQAAWAVAWTEGGAGLFRTDDFVDTEDIPCMDAHITLERARLEEARPAIWVDRARDPLGDRATLLLAAYAVGLADQSCDLTIGYAKALEQFGKPAGAIHTIKQNCADMAMLVEIAWCETVFAAVTLAKDGSDARFHCAAAKLLAADAALKNATRSIQAHELFGFTTESDAHLFLKRAHVIDVLGGDLRAQRAALLREAAPF